MDTKLKPGYLHINHKYVSSPNIAIGCIIYTLIGQDIEYLHIIYEGVEYEFVGSTLCLDNFAFCLEYSPVKLIPVKSESNEKQFDDFDKKEFVKYMKRFSDYDKLEAILLIEKMITKS